MISSRPFIAPPSPQKKKIASCYPAPQFFGPLQKVFCWLQKIYIYLFFNPPTPQKFFFVVVRLPPKRNLCIAKKRKLKIIPSPKKLLCDSLKINLDRKKAKKIDPFPFFLHCNGDTIRISREIRYAGFFFEIWLGKGKTKYTFSG